MKYKNVTIKLGISEARISTKGVDRTDATGRTRGGLRVSEIAFQRAAQLALPSCKLKRQADPHPSKIAKDYAIAE